MKRRPLLAGNWKMHGLRASAGPLLDAIRSAAREVPDREVVVAPPFTLLEFAGRQLLGSGVALAAQDLFWEDEGAFTGEVSAPMLREAGCTYVIVGHSERRRYFGETDEWVGRKVEAALRHGLVPIVCVGERLEEREAGRTLDVVGRQLRAALQGLDRDALARTVVAYEPVWAIGTGRVATPAQAQEVHAFVRKTLSELGGLAEAIRILYGGSVKADNIDGLMREPDIDGVLVGGASLKADEFARIVRYRV